MSKETQFDFLDTSLREGEQSPLLKKTGKEFFTPEDAVEITDFLIRIGVRYIEFFSPTSPFVKGKETKDKDTRHKDIVQAVIERKRQLKKEEGTNSLILAHTRCVEKDIKMALDEGVDGVNIYIGTSTQSLNGNGRKLVQIRDMVSDTIANLRKDYPNLYIRFSGEDGFRTSNKDLMFVFDPLSDDVDTFGIPDTVGIANPSSAVRKFSFFRKRLPKNKLECHFHNDEGNSIQNVFAVIKAGVVDIADVSVFGLGERNGIPPFGDALYKLFLENKNLVNKFNTSLLRSLEILFGEITGLDPDLFSLLSPIIRTHVAGVHASAILRNGNTYEAHSEALEAFGVSSQSELPLGCLSGKNVMAHRLEQLGYDRDDPNIPRATEIFRAGLPGKIEEHACESADVAGVQRKEQTIYSSAR